MIQRAGYSAMQAVEDYKAWLLGDVAGRFSDTEAIPPTIEAIRRYLGGKNLACWCSIDAPCHANLLLQLANPAPRHADDDLA